MRDWTSSCVYVSVSQPFKGPEGPRKGEYEVYEPEAQGASTQELAPQVQELAKILFDLVDGLRQATSLTDVKIEAGIAWERLLTLEAVDLAHHASEELADVLELPL